MQHAWNQECPAVTGDGPGESAAASPRRDWHSSVGARGVQLGFSAAARELEAWLVGCHARLQVQAARAPSRADPAWRREYDCIEEVRRAPTCHSRAQASVCARVHSLRTCRVCGAPGPFCVWLGALCGSCVALKPALADPGQRAHCVDTQRSEPAGAGCASICGLRVQV